jgi:hypothetical protein
VEQHLQSFGEALLLRNLATKHDTVAQHDDAELSVRLGAEVWTS